MKKKKLNQYLEQADALIEEFGSAHKESRAKIRQAIDILEKKMFEDLCNKSHYKTECEPAYCSYQGSGTCDYIKNRKLVFEFLHKNRIYP